jgi:hypothetical protein
MAKIKIIIFNVHNAPRNSLIPVGDRTAYLMAFVNALRDFGQLRPETHHLLWDIIDRMWRSVKPGQPFPCLEDLRRILDYEAKRLDRENLLTISRAVHSLCTVLGDAARIRKPADLETDCRRPIVEGKDS